ncbi:MAG: PPK2 family polyphosphate kinase [Gammaproteobacteria bacterium]
MFLPPTNDFTVPFDQTFKISDTQTSSPDKVDSNDLKKQLKKITESLDELQRTLYAHDKHSLLLVFQAMDAAGKDGTIRAVLSGINPAGCQVFSFKQPSSLELDHDFLWRSAKRLPERGRIGVFNRSYYEEVLVVKVHPEYLNGQKLPDCVDAETIWQQRYESICDHEKHLAHNGTVILKFWLNVSKDEQKQRFLSRLNEPEKNWKFSSTDIKERGYWDQYMEAYEELLNKTSKPWAPWHAIPADNKKWMRVEIAKIVKDTLESLEIDYPKVDKKEKLKFDEMRNILENEK